VDALPAGGRRARRPAGGGGVRGGAPVAADLGVRRAYDPGDRLFALELGGGALLDLGVYVVSFAQHFLGAPDRVTATGSLAPTGVDAEAGVLLGDPDTVTATGSRFETGVDAEAALLLGYADGRSATLMTSLRNALPGQARVFGTAGWVDVLPRFHHPQTIVVHRAGADPEEITLPQLGSGYSHELIEVTECVRAGRSESAVMPLADTVAVQDVLEQAAGQLGVTFAEDPAVL